MKPGGPGEKQQHMKTTHYKKGGSSLCNIPQSLSRMLSALAIVTTAALPSVVTPKTKERAWSDLYRMARLVTILVADGHTVYGSVESCIADNQHSPAPVILSSGTQQVHLRALTRRSP